MPSVLSYSIDAEGALFLCTEQGRPLIVDEWGLRNIVLTDGAPASIGPLNLLLEQEKAEESEDRLGVKVSHRILAGLEAWQVKGLGLPPLAPFRLVIETRGTLASERFQIAYGFTYPDSLPVTGAVRKGTVVDCGAKRFLLPDPLYSIAELLDAYCANPIMDMDERFLWWGRVRELLPEDASIGNFLRTINIVKPESFTLDFTERDGDFVIIPRFVLPHTPSGLDDAPPSEREPESLIPPAVQGDFATKFLREPAARARYALSQRWFVVIPPTLRTALQAVRELKGSKPEQKLAFLQNPRAELRQRLEGTVDETVLESLFVETPLFLNERIKNLGVWEPKAGLFIKTETGRWLPEDGPPPAVGLPLEGGVYIVATKNLPGLAEVMGEALERGQKAVEFEAHRYPVSQAALETVRKAAQIFAPPERPAPPKEKQPETLRPPPLAVPIIYDHIAELGILVDTRGRRQRIWEGEPSLAAGVRLHAHQQDGLAWLQEHWCRASPGALLADDMGLGKTLQTLAFMNWVRLQMDKGYVPRRPFLVVAPTGLLKNWEVEAAKFLDPPGLGVLLRAHGASFSVAANMGWTSAATALKEAGWVLTTYETLRDKIMTFTGVHFAVAVFDEAQKIKNPKAMVTDMAKSVKAEITLALTGTPVENTLADLWCIVDAVHPGRFDTLKNFAKRYMPEGRPRQEELETLKAKLSQPSGTALMLRRTKDEHWKERPAKSERLHERTMPQKQADTYATAVLRAKGAAGKKGAMLEALQSLRAISLHPFLHEGIGDHEEFIAASARLETTVGLLDEIARLGEKVLIFVEYLRMQSILSEIITRRYGCRKVMIISGEVSGAKRQARVDEFQGRGKGFDAMILSPKAGGVGLNLTSATHVIHLSRWWNPAVEDQCSDRAYRIGQTSPVTIHYPVALHPIYGREHSFDIKLHNLLEKKRHLSRTLLAPPAGTDHDIEELFADTVARSPQ